MGAVGLLARSRLRSPAQTSLDCPLPCPVDGEGQRNSNSKLGDMLSPFLRGPWQRRVGVAHLAFPRFRGAVRSKCERRLPLRSRARCCRARLSTPVWRCCRSAVAFLAKSSDLGFSGLLGGQGSHPLVLPRLYGLWVPRPVRLGAEPVVYIAPRVVLSTPLLCPAAWHAAMEAGERTGDSNSRV